MFFKLERYMHCAYITYKYMRKYPVKYRADEPWNMSQLVFFSFYANETE